MNFIGYMSFYFKVITDTNQYAYLAMNIDFRKCFDESFIIMLKEHIKSSYEKAYSCKVISCEYVSKEEYETDKEKPFDGTELVFISEENSETVIKNTYNENNNKPIKTEVKDYRVWKD